MNSVKIIDRKLVESWYTPLTRREYGYGKVSIESMGIRIGDQLLRVTASAGVAEFRGDEDPDAVFARADAALYRAKRNGRNRCERA